MGANDCAVDGNSYRQPHNRSREDGIARLATRQGGVVGRRQLVALGLEQTDIDYRVKLGRLRVYYRGVYAVGHEALQLRGRLVAALLIAGPGAAISHRAAGGLYKMLPSMPPFVEITTTTKRHRNRPGLVFHHATTIETQLRHGLPLTTPARTLRDLAATRPYQELERACSEALVLGLITSDELTRQTGPGSAVLKRLVSDGVAPTRSELERRFNRAMRKAGLPLAIANEDVCGEEVDFHWPEPGLIVEVDGWRFHGHRIAFERDRARDATHLLAGWTVLRFTWRQLRDEPERVAAFLSRPASRRAA
jgi:very-short-patch-repair endonuclease